ncbi:MAG TPA: phosphoribosyltransferase family protein [Nitrococcus sp.]|nr:phosphoribosyltransferase family protein [Nitrococcus sp.]
MFKNRADAAQQLAQRLQHLKGEHPLVLAIPRGAVPMAKLIADALDGELDTVLVHKLGAPGNPEYAIGAVSEDGTVKLSEQRRKLYSEDYIEREVDAQLNNLRERRRRYTPVRPPIDPSDRVVIVVDDGSATGATMIAALQTLRQRKPRRLIAALGVAPPDALRRFEEAADAVICLAAPAVFCAVGQHFSDFSQVSDEEVIELLRQSTRHEAAPGK